MNIDYLLSQILYSISGFFFGIFASRYSVLSLQNIINLYHHKNWLQIIPYLVFLTIAFLIFPVWFITKTELGGFIYYAILLFYFNKGYHNLKG